ncbi:MAG: hypothetical protein JST25_01980 [Actinobacteria bacterium]|nr:hypothetical protein [Actinomycetota bacterium]
MTALYVSAEDLALEGPDAVCARAAAWGVDELAVSYAYHAARDVAPHSGAGAIARADGIHFVPDPQAFAGSGLVPAVLQSEAGFAARVADAAARNGLGVLGWTVFLHNEELGRRHPELTQRTLYGTHAAPADLCPAQPRVRAYCGELARAVAGLGVRTVIAESLHHGAFGHGYHHERDMVGLGPIEAFLLGLCFCAACGQQAQAQGVDAARAQSQAQEYLDPRLDGHASCSAADRRLTVAELAHAVGADLAAFAEARTAVTTSLVAEVGATLGAVGVRLVVLDLTGAHQGYGDGLPPEVSGLDESWQFGIDVAAVSAHADVGILAYARDPERIAAETARYRSRLAAGSALRVILRPGRPDCDDAENLTVKAASVREAGATADFYHYGIYPFPVLDRIGSALRG